MPPKQKQKKKFQQLEHLDHILHRPDSYVGSIRNKSLEEYVSTAEKGFRMEKQNVKYSSALVRVFVEPLSNTIDNFFESKGTDTPCKTIKVNIDEKTGETKVWNDGNVISIDKDNDNDNGCYNHTLIFGNLLTSSNYDDDKERYNVSGRNGYGIKLCLKAGSLIPLWNGDIKKIEDLELGEKIIGDDGTPRNILNKITGNGKLYEVSQFRGQSYIVNENHILSVRMPDHKVIFWNTAKSGWSMLWLNKSEKKVHMKSISATKPKIVCPECQKTLGGNLNRHWKRVHPNKPKPKPTSPRAKPTIIPPDTNEVKIALEKMKEFADTVEDDNTLDISIKEYMKMTTTTKGRLTGFAGDCVQWEEQKVELDPYVLGLWLGDGYKNGYCMAINSQDDPEILEYLEKWGEENDATFKHHKNNPVAFGISSTTNSGVAPLKKLLKIYNLVDNKHIPMEYLVNTREVRLAVLAGLIDSDGTVQRDGTRIVIAQGLNHSKLATDIIYLVKSLGFMCCSTMKKTQWKYKGELKRGQAININISGVGVEDIPTLVKRKKCCSPVKRNTLNTGKLKVKEVESGDFVGISVDCNQRFVLEDFTVTHNCNIFSTSFKVRGNDPDEKKLFKQEWKDNVKTVGKPIVTTSKLKKGFTEVTWTPDFKKFGVKGYSPEIINLYCRYVVDAAMITGANVYFNDELIPVKNLFDYSKLYMNTLSDEILNIKEKDYSIVAIPSSGFQAISFANGVFTSLGGTHVDFCVEKLFRPIVKKLTKPKGPTFTIADVKKFFKIFVSVSVDKPEFESQSKLKLESSVNLKMPKKYITKILKWSVLDDILRSKELGMLKKIERKKRNFTKIEGLDSANNEGSKQSGDCTLILVEGLSAKTYAVQGIEVGAFGKKGRDWFGIYPLRGKLLNVRNAKVDSISKNKVVGDIVKALGAEVGLDYTKSVNFQKLRYGKVMIITDADVDGIHITGLIQNFFHNLYPSLYKRDTPYITGMQTPIVRVFLKSKELIFYDERDYKKYVETYSKSIH